MVNFYNPKNGEISDELISTIKNTATEMFANNGYAGTSIDDIAKAAGVDSYEIIKYYKNKDNLFNEIVNEMTDLDSMVECCGTVLEMFVAITDSIKTEILEDTKRARFIDMFIRSRSIPETCKRAYIDKLSASRFYKSVDNARVHGILVGKDTLSLIRMYLKSTFSIVYGYKLSGMKIPDNEWFLRILHFAEEDKNENLEELVKKQNSVITAFAADFDSILFVNLDADSIEVYQANGDDDSWIMSTASKGYMEFRRRFSERFLFEEDKEWFLRETEPLNVMNQLEEDPILYIDHRIISRGEPYYYQTIIVLDPMYSYGNRILIAGHRIYGNRKPAMPSESDITEKIAMN